MTISKRKGFTLIEILIVVAIIGVLASLVLVGLGPIQKRGRDARRISDLKQIQQGLELYYSRNGVYPVADFAGMSTALIGGSLGISDIPNDPRAGASYLYWSDGTTYLMQTTLEDSSNPALTSGNYKGSIPSGSNMDCDPAQSHYCVSL